MGKRGVGSGRFGKRRNEGRNKRKSGERNEKRIKT